MGTGVDGDLDPQRTEAGVVVGGGCRVVLGGKGKRWSAEGAIPAIVEYFFGVIILLRSLNSSS